MRFISFLQSSLNHTVKHYSGYFTTLIASLVVIICGATISALISFVSNKFFVAINIDVRNYFLLQGAYSITGALIMFIIVTFLTGLIVLNSLNTNGTTQNAKDLMSQFISYLFLNIFIAIAAFIATSPLVGLSLLQYTFRDAQNILSPLLLLSAICLQVIVVLFFATTPFLMLDKKLHLKETLKKNVANVSKHFGLLMKRTFGVFVFLVIINMGLAIKIDSIATLWALCFPLFFAPFLVSYLTLTYREINS